jgi:hypothetical protein
MRRPTTLSPEAALLSAGALLVTLGLALPSRAFPASATPALQGTGTGGTPPQQPVPPTVPGGLPSIGTADSNQQMIAVTGIDLTGSSILYLVDTQHRQLAVYQASGGTQSMQGVRLVGARRIDLDLQLEGYNDKSEYSFEQLEQRFSQIGRPARAADGK